MFLPYLLFLIGCGPSTGHQVASTVSEGTTINTLFAPPAGFRRQVYHPETFAFWLGNVNVLPEGTQVALYSGTPKNRQDVHAAVLDVSVGTKDLQQCADAVMRLRAEYWFQKGRFDDIHYQFTSGFSTNFRRWVNGQRIQVDGPHGTRWFGTAAKDSSHTTLLEYLEKVFTYAGTLSLSKELRSVGTSLVEPGDVFIHGGSPGHAVIVMDVADHTDGRQAFLIAQSYMPAQQIHVLKNTRQPELGAWFILGDGNQFYTPEWTFDWNERKRW